LRRRVEAQAKAGDAIGAIDSFTRLIALNPDGQYYLLRGRFAASLGQVASAHADLDEAVRRLPEQPDAWLGRAEFLRDQHDWVGAQSDLDRALALRAPDTHTWIFRAELDLYRGLFRDAVHDVEEALRLEPDNLGAIRFHVTALVHAGDYDKALAELRRAHEREPLGADARMLGAIQFMQGNYAESAAAWSTATDDPTNAAYYPLWRYLALRRANMPREAASALGMTPAKAWPGPIVALYLGRINAFELMAAARQAESVRPETQICEAWFYAGEAELDARHIPETVDLLRQAVAICPAPLTERKLALAELRRLGVVD
jgi:tetratricopeptide (TPR) repeat protein